MPVDLMSLVPVGTAILGAALAYLTFSHDRKKDAAAEGQNSGTVLTTLGHVQAGIDDIKATQREQAKTNIEMLTRLVAVESSAKQAHHRIDRIEEKGE